MRVPSCKCKHKDMGHETSSHTYSGHHSATNATYRALLIPTRMIYAVFTRQTPMWGARWSGPLHNVFVTASRCCPRPRLEKGAVIRQSREFLYIPLHWLFSAIKGKQCLVTSLCQGRRCRLCSTLRFLSRDWCIPSWDSVCGNNAYL